MLLSMALGTGLSVSDFDLMTWTLRRDVSCLLSKHLIDCECLMARSLLLLETKNSYIQSFKDSMNSMILCYYILTIQ